MSVSPGTDSFGVIVPMYAAAMLRLAAAYVGPADAEDAVQEAAMRAWQAWPTLRDRAAVRPWLLQITMNVCRSWRRGLKGQQQAHLRVLPDDSSPLLALLDLDPGTSDHTGALDLRAAVSMLPDELRSVVILRFYAGLDATEIGSALGIPSGTVRSRLHRALTQVHERLVPPGLPHGTRVEREERA
ncbi:MAG: RNA polymerase sigma factor [Ktedonobacterales bacterium]